MYIEKLIYPAYLSNDYSFNVIKIVSNPLFSVESMLGILILAILIFLPLHPKTRYTIFGLAAAIFLLPYLLVSNFVLTIGTIMGERLIYFSSLGFVLALAYLLYLLEVKYKVWPEVPWIILAVIVLLFSVRTVVRNEDWLSNDNLYAVNLKAHPEGFLTQLYWATTYLAENNNAEGEKHLAEAQKIYPNNPKLIIVKGNVAERTGNPALAEKYYKEAIKDYSLSIEAYSDLGHLYFGQQRYKEAADSLLKSISLYPAPSEITYYARTEMALKNPDKGIEVIHKYFGDNPKSIEVITALGYSYFVKGDYKNALIYLEKSKQLGNVNQEIESMMTTAKEMLNQ